MDHFFLLETKKKIFMSMESCYCQKECEMYWLWTNFYDVTKKVLKPEIVEGETRRD